MHYLQFLGFAVLASALRAEPVPADPFVELTPLLVNGSRELPPPQSWRHTTIPKFEVLSSASDRTTQRLLRDFDLFRQALGYVWPLPKRTEAPTPLIICARSGEFAAFVPAGRSTPDTALASLFLHQGNQSAIVINLAATTLDVLNTDVSNDAATGTDSSLVAVDHDKQLYREYVRYLLSTGETRQPAWLEEGLAQIITRIQFTARTIILARLEETNTVSAAARSVATFNTGVDPDGNDGALLPGAPLEDRDFNSVLRRRRLLPFQQFFTITADSPEAMNPLGNNRWAKQAYAFVHLCLYGEGGKYQKAFATFLARQANQPVTEALFKECFKLSYDQMATELRGYIDFTAYQAKEYRAKQDMIIAPPPPELRAATESEIGRLKGEALVLAGKDELAHRELTVPYLRGERDPQLLAALGLFEQTKGTEDRARKFLTAAVAAKTTRPEAYIELVRYRYNDALAARTSPQTLLSADQVTSLLETLFGARAYPPPRAAVYELAADIWIHGARKPTREDVSYLVQGVRQFPTRLMLTLQTAALCANAGLLEAAHSLVDHGLKIANDPAVRAPFEKLKASLPPLPTTPASTPAPR